MKIRHMLISVAAVVFATSSMAQDLVRPVKLAVLEDSSGISEREFFGIIVARQTVDLAFQVGGQILNFPVIEGSRLSKGELIAELDLVPFNLLLEQAKLEHEQAIRLLDRQKKLGPNTVSQVSIDDAATAADLAAIAVKDAELDLARATLGAPFDALVAARNLANFSTIESGTPVARLHDISELRVEIDVPEVMFRRAAQTGGTEIFARIPGDGTHYPLEIREFEADTSSVGQTYRVTLAMPPIEDPYLIPGASVVVIARQPLSDHAVRIPATAVVIDPDKSTHVMVFEPTGADEGVVRKAPVELNPTDGGDFTLLSGPEPGSEIVVAGATFIADGQTVRRYTNISE